MALAGRCNELQALVFDPQIYCSNIRGMALPYISPRSSCDNQRPFQVHDPWYTPMVLTGRLDFDAPIAQLERSGIITDT